MEFEDQYSRQAGRPGNRGLIPDGGKRHFQRVQTGPRAQPAPF
jgi:hypothetical protein